MGMLANYLHHWHLRLSVAKTVCTGFHLCNREASRELRVLENGICLKFQPAPTDLAVTLDRTLQYHNHLTNLGGKVAARSALIRHRN